ncbi:MULTISPECIES: polysaccharide deacetylase family protein [Actinoplanes]|uniref:polysaccharide deacetylase family protein n=1 Tax=Actinoplanes TaxID=1865 RepID=UPI0007C808D3|nr:MULTISPECIES: polysaccharide deacetylase family protein [Actinoplanes]GLY03539.1 hypothetical protein Acsp01_39180 [Actinoplanes sp. NBRC 101535]
MPPHRSPHSSPRVGDENTPIGRHRRPDSLADYTTVAGLADTKTRPVPLPRQPADPDATAYVSRAARHRSENRRGGNTGPRWQPQPTDRPGTYRSSSGAHRAPSARRFDGLLKSAKNKPQLLLATLVAAGLLLTAMPFQQKDGESTSVMNAAAQAVAERISGQPAKKPATVPAEKEVPDAVPAQPAATEAPSPPAPEPSRSAERPATSETAKVSVPAGDGPHDSLKTTGSSVVALTFDDGPDPEQTPKILKMLDTYQLKAVFCLVGTQAQRHPDLVRQIVDEGHVLCNHTWNHDLSIGKKKAANITADLQKTDAAIRAAVPDAEIPFFRAPGGNFTDRLVKTAYANGQTSLYWEVDPRDWDHPDGESDAQRIKRIISIVKKETRQGSIVLSHDFNQPGTIKAYEKLLPWLAANFEIGIPGEQQSGETPETPASPEPSTPSTSPGTVAPSPSGSASPVTTDGTTLQVSTP